MDELKQIGAWAIVIALLGMAVVLAAQDARRERAQRRSTVGGREIRYGPPGSYHPRSSLWFGLLWMWIGGSAALASVVVLSTMPSVPPAAVLIAAGVSALSLLVGGWLLIGYLRTDVVEGTVLERRILITGEERTRGYWIAVDDGSTPVDGTAVSAADYTRVTPGALVRLRLTARGRQLRSLEVLRLPASANAAQAPTPPPDLLVTPVQAARALGCPVEWVPAAPDVPGTRVYLYVPPGAQVADGTAWAPSLRVTEASDADATNALARRLTADRPKRWHHGDQSICRRGMRYLLTWGAGGLLIEGRVDVNETSGLSRLVYALKAPKPPRPQP
ncbi:hypothetical protein [Catellatospora methionotrophica]|uniref:hypothetical protein n=1 Tax=Catellatospora methionotrophica TaxID=121620 RepID=UPI0033E4892E